MKRLLAVAIWLCACQGAQNPAPTPSTEDAWASIAESLDFAARLSVHDSPGAMQHWASAYDTFEHVLEPSLRAEHSDETIIKVEFAFGQLHQAISAPAVKRGALSHHSSPRKLDVEALTIELTNEISTLLKPVNQNAVASK